MNLKLLKQAVDAGLFTLDEAKQATLDRIFGTEGVTVEVKVEEKNQSIVPVSVQPDARIYQIRNVYDAIIKVLDNQSNPITIKEIALRVKALPRTYSPTYFSTSIWEMIRASREGVRYYDSEGYTFKEGASGKFYKTK